MHVLSSLIILVNHIITYFLRDKYSKKIVKNAKNKYTDFFSFSFHILRGEKSNFKKKSPISSCSRVTPIFRSNNSEENPDHQIK